MNIEIDLPKSFDTVLDSGFETLLVSGCSFTANTSDVDRVSWPYVLADKLNIPKVINTAIPAVGNEHISHSIQWILETNQFDVAKTLVIIMWSGNGRESDIVESRHIRPGVSTYYYADKVATAILNHGGSNNVRIKQHSYKGPPSSAVQSYLNINSLYHYLMSNKYKFIFLDFMDRTLPNRSGDFELRDLLPKAVHSKIDKMIPKDIENFYRWSLKNDLLCDDDFHPNAAAHEGWCSEILVPYVVNKFNLTAHTHAV